MNDYVEVLQIININGIIPITDDYIINLNQNIHAHDVTFTTIKIIDQYVSKYNITNITQFWDKRYNKTNIIKHFNQT